jgi:hypothetical protein
MEQLWERQEDLGLEASSRCVVNKQRMSFGSQF